MGGFSAPRLHRAQRAPQARIHRNGFMRNWERGAQSNSLGRAWEVSTRFRVSWVALWLGCLGGARGEEFLRNRDWLVGDRLLGELVGVGTLGGALLLGGGSAGQGLRSQGSHGRWGFRALQTYGRRVVRYCPALSSSRIRAQRSFGNRGGGSLARSRAVKGWVGACSTQPSAQLQGLDSGGWTSRSTLQTLLLGAFTKAAGSRWKGSSERCASSTVESKTWCSWFLE